MIVKRAFFILLGILFMMGPVTAYYASSVSFSPGDMTTDWIIADVGQKNILTLEARNITLGPVINAPVTFTLDNPLLGTISPKNTQTDNNGIVNCTFTVNSTHPYSGTATITADVISSDGTTYHTIRTWAQKIDHNVPYKAVFVYSNEVAVESVMPVKISIFDRWDNRVDDRFEIEKSYPVHNITLHVNGPSPPNNCGFTDFGLVHDKKFDLDSNGEVTVKITPATKPGWHYILMDRMGSIPEQMKLFNTIANGVPFSMTQTFSPDGNPYATVLADGTSRFNFFYTLYDKYGNPTRDQWVWINTSVPGEGAFNKSIENGQVWSFYGPKSYTGMFTITATPAGNSSLSLSKIVRFYNTSPQNLDLSANPESLPSRDANPLIYSDLVAKVTDIMGNGAPGETVTFTLHDITLSPVDANETKAASFSSGSLVLNTSAISDAQGFATVKIYPSGYATISQPGYKEQVTGTGIVTASWNGNQRDIKITWKNYPYLSAIVAVNPPQVKVGDTVDVSIKLNGDGWALVGKPADIVIVTDLAGGIGGATRLADTKVAEIGFVNNATDGTYISLVSFGRSPTPHPPFASANTIALWNLQKADGIPRFQAWSGAPMDTNMVPPEHWDGCNKVTECPNASVAPYNYLNPSPDAKIEMDFTDHANKSALITVINGYQDYGGTNYGSGINAAIQEFNTHGTPGRSKTIIIMGDGINMMAPSSPGSLESYWPSDWYPRSNLGWMDESDIGKAAAIDAANRAKAQGITIYGAGFPTPIGGGNYVDTDLMTAMCSPGCYYYAPSTTQLGQIFQTILGKVQTEASVDTKASMDFGNLIVNNAPVAAGTYFDYVANTTVPGSTMLDKYSKNTDGSIKLHMSPGLDAFNVSLPVGPIIINQSDYWVAHPQQLAFNIGTIKVNESWETNFRLKVLQEGNILVFGPQSQVCFENGAAGDSCMTLPNLSLSSSMNPLNLGLSGASISVTGLTRTDTGPVKGTLPITWATIYNGDKVITEEVSYIHDNDPPVKFEIKTIDPAAGPIPTMSSTLNMDKLPSGGYRIQVHAFTADASDKKECGPYSYTTQGRAFIKIE